MRTNISELLKQPYAQDTLEMMGMLKPADEFTAEEIEKLEPLWKRTEATAVPLHICTKTEVDRKWWKEAVMYQIYPMSFCDSNGDGIGDIGGIISKLDYLKNLGIDVIWLSPIYDSPNDDNGYDIRDYKNIHTDYGTMEDFDRLLDEVHKRGMKLIMDMVLNHSSDEHEWFRAALKDPTSKYKDYYIWRKGKDENTPPNNWTSFFSETAWNYYPEVGEWALHLFSRKQMDLNWENPELRKEVYEMLNWWMQKGIDGFRLDVINLISKFEGLPDGEMGGLVGCEQYMYGPKLHEYLHEMNREVFSKYDCYTVGEGCGVGRRCQLYMTLPERQELDTCFWFNYLDDPGHNKYSIYRYDLNYLKKCLLDVQHTDDVEAWPTVVFDNHDNPRFLSKITWVESEREPAAKMIALLSMVLSGTVYIYEGQELGMNHVDFKDVSEFRDVEAINRYKFLVAEGMSPEDAFKSVAPGTRDQTRAPMQWTKGENGGFTTGTPWLRLNDNCELINAEDEMKDENSVYNFYRKAIALRHEYKTLVYGKFEPVCPEVKDFFGFTKTDKDGKFYIEINLTAEENARPVQPEGELILSNYGETADNLRAFEINLYKVK